MYSEILFNKYIIEIKKKEDKPIIRNLTKKEVEEFLNSKISNRNLDAKKLKYNKEEVKLLIEENEKIIKLYISDGFENENEENKYIKVYKENVEKINKISIHILDIIKYIKKTDKQILNIKFDILNNKEIKSNQYSGYSILENRR